MNTIERLHEFLKEADINISQFEKTIGVSNGTIRKAIAEKKSIGINIVEKILSVYVELNPRWLLTGQGEMSWTKEAMKNEKVSGDYDVLMKQLITVSKHNNELQYTIELQKGTIERLESLVNELKRSKGIVEGVDI